MFQEFASAVLEWAATTGLISIVALTIYVAYKLLGYVHSKRQ